MTDVLIDTRYQVETPEGVDLQAQAAGPVPRILAYTIDLSFRTAAIIVFSIIVSILGKAGQGFILLFAFLLEWFYPVFFEVLRNGQTPGKQILGLAVVNDDLTPIGWNNSLVRNLLRAVDFLPLFYIGGLLCMVITRNFQRLGDIAAGSLVVYRDKTAAEVAPPPVAPRTPDIPLELEDQIAIIDFTQRHNQLSEDRQRELANILQPATGATDAEAVNYLQGVGRWLLGERH